MIALRERSLSTCSRRSRPLLTLVVLCLCRPAQTPIACVGGGGNPTLLERLRSEDAEERVGTQGCQVPGQSGHIVSAMLDYLCRRSTFARAVAGSNDGGGLGDRHVQDLIGIAETAEAVARRVIDRSPSS